MRTNVHREAPAHMPEWAGAVFLLGRLVFGGFFVWNGLSHFLNYGGALQVAQGAGLPVPGVMVVVAGLLLLFGGVSMIIGLVPVAGVGALVTYLLLAAFLVHPYWIFEDPQARMLQMQFFLRNLALSGAALALLAVPRPWPYSAEEQRQVPRRVEV